MKTKDRIITIIVLLALALGLCMAFFCEPGWLKIIGLVMATISAIVAIDYMAEGL